MNAKTSKFVDPRAANGLRYVRAFTVPRTLAPDRILIHNRVMHTVDMPCGVNGFRAWTEDAPAPRGQYEKCNCGWSGLPHYKNRGAGDGLFSGTLPELMAEVTAEFAGA